MPSAPLFYQPLVQARVLMTPIHFESQSAPPVDTDVFMAQKAGAEMTDKASKDEKFGPKMQGILRGFENAQAGLPGSKTLDLIQFSYDEPGYIANRVATTLRLHPELFDTASPDQAAEVGAKLVQEATKELAENPGMKAVGDTLEVAPDATYLLRQHWEGNELGVDDAAYLGVTAARELQRAVTPLPPDATSPLDWIEQGTVWKLGMWPGAASKTAAALGIKLDAKAVEDTVAGWRDNMQAVEPKAVGPVKAVSALLGAAGMGGTEEDALASTYAVLQGTPLEGVPAGIAQAIVTSRGIAPDKKEYLANRIVETGGSEGNVAGLLAEIDKLTPPKPPGPVDPPGPGPGGPVDPPKTDPDPGGPVDPPKPEPDPGGPVDPPGPTPDPAPAPTPAPDPAP
ncbi:MAG: hypothetical protein JWM98_1421, partial [Thermoleophilia bacterium]|nr:hypothetical protein [Thermoleophilia bacterium]